MANVYPGSNDTPGGALARERVAESTSEAAEPSIATLLGSLVADAQDLVRKEVELAKQEVKVEVNKAKDSAISLGIGGAVAAVGGLMLVFMLVHLLADLLNIPLWSSYLIVGALFAIVGAFLLQRGRSKMNEVDLVPRETIESVKKDVEWIKEQNPSDKI